MKVLFYVNILSGGGAERVIANLANNFYEKGHEIIVVNTFPTEKEYHLNKDIKHLYMESQKDCGNVLKKNITRIGKLRKILKKEKPDVAVAFMREPNWRLVIASKGLKVKTIVSLRVTPEHEDGKFPKNFMLRYPFKKADAVIFQTEHAQQYFDESIVKHSKIILNPIKNGIYDINYKGERKNIVTAGRLASTKNQLLLINAFSKVADTTEDKLLIYGEGECRQALQNRIDELRMNDKIILMGNSSNLHEEIKSAKVFVLSSDLEGLPNALMEAMALGLPCISTDCQGGGARMVIQDGKNGFIVPVGDTNALAEKIKYVLSLSDKERDEIGKSAKETAQGFRADVICKEWEEYIYSLLKSKT